MAPESNVASNDILRRDMAQLVRLAALSLLCTLAISWPLYLPGHRIFALAPLVPSFAAAPVWLDQGIYIFCLICLAALLALPQKTLPAFGVLACELFWVLQDANRMQPYNYMYCYTLLIAALCRHRKGDGLDALRLMVCGVYFWAGFHKINATFYDSIFPWFIAPIHHFSAGRNLLDLPFATALLITPFFEASIGILLLFPRWRRLATIMAFTMLMTVLLCLGPMGHDYGMIVWPWNVYLFLMEFVLFFRPQTGAAQPFWRLHRWHMPSLVLFVLAPALAILTPWYSLLGFKLYSGNIVMAEVALSPKERLEKLPLSLAPLVRQHRLGLIGWTVSELKNVVYPAPYIFKTGARGLCPYLDHPDEAKLVLSYPPPFYSVMRTTRERPLCQ